MFNKKPNSEEELKKYSAVLIHLSINVSEELEKEYSLKENEFNDISMQAIGFCLINLMKQFHSNGVAPGKSKTAIESILSNIAMVLADANGNSQQAVYQNLNKKVGGLVTEYGMLPLKHQDKNKGEGGTLLWEYGKHMTATIHRDPSSDPITIMKCISLITNTNNAIQTNELVKSLK